MLCWCHTLEEKILPIIRALLRLAFPLWGWLLKKRKQILTAIIIDAELLEWEDAALLSAAWQWCGPCVRHVVDHVVFTKIRAIFYGETRL